MPLASIVTPTHARHDLLLNRCIPSVQVQTHQPVEHIVVSDRDDILRARIKEEAPHVRFIEINDVWRNETSERSTGAWPWFIGTNLAFGDYVGFLGDDDEFLPEHVEKHIAAMEREKVDYSISKVAFFVDGEYVFDVGTGRIKVTHLDSDGIMGRIGNLKKANWLANGNISGDFELVLNWHKAGLKGVFVPEVTANHYDGWLKGHPELVEAHRRGEDWRQVALGVIG